MSMCHRLSVIVFLGCAIALMCGSGDCEQGEGTDCSKQAMHAFTGFYICMVAMLESTVPREDDMREFTKAELTLGPSTSERGVHTSQTEADFAEFWANQTDGPFIYMCGNFTQDGEDVTVNLAPLATLEAGTPQSITIHLTFTDDDHASGSLDYVESGITFRGDIDIERQEEE